MAVTVFLNDFPVFDAIQANRYFQNTIKSSNRQYIDSFNRADLLSMCNRFVSTAGATPSYGYFVVSRKAALELSNTDITLTFRENNSKIVQEGLVMVKGTGLAPVKPTRPSDSDTFVVEIADKRYYGANMYVRADDSAQKLFNVPAPLYGKDQFYTDSLDASLGAGLEIQWDWQAMLDEVWPSYLGTAPTLPRTYASYPVGFDFRAFTNYQALQIILSSLNLSMALKSDGSFDLVDFGDTSGTAYALNERLKGVWRQALDERIEWIEPAKTNFPIGVKVHFHKTSVNSGSENMNTMDNGQWYTDMDYAISVPCTAAMVGGNSNFNNLMTGYLHQMWDDLPAWVDPYTGVVENLTALQARAQERADNYFGDLVKPSLRMRESYSAVIDFEVCGTLQARAWRQCMSRGGAWITEIFCHPRLQMDATKVGQLVPETIKPSSPWQWKAAPVYPPDTVLWRNDGLLTSGSATATRDDEYNGTELRYDPVTKTYVEGIYMKGAGCP